MTADQIAYLISNSGEPTDSPALVRLVGLSSGRTFSIFEKPNVPGAYTLAFNDSQQLVSFTPANPNSLTSGVVPAVEYASYDSIEAMALFPAGTTGATGATGSGSWVLLQPTGSSGATGSFNE